jgi:hypothetical protein
MGEGQEEQQHSSVIHQVLLHLIRTGKGYGNCINCSHCSNQLINPTYVLQYFQFINPFHCPYILVIRYFPMSSLVFCIYLHYLCIQLTDKFMGKEKLISYYDIMAESQNGGAAGGGRCWEAVWKHISEATDQHTTTEELLEAMLLCSTCHGSITRTSERN